jgi:hypothetical protein
MLRRLTRAQFRNAVRDVFGVEVDVSQLAAGRRELAAAIGALRTKTRFATFMFSLPAAHVYYRHPRHDSSYRCGRQIGSTARRQWRAVRDDVAERAAHQEATEWPALLVGKAGGKLKRGVGL